MVKLDGGTFKMGTADIRGEGPIHDVTVATFCMDRTEVTAAAYDECLKAGACTPAKPQQTPPAICTTGKSDRKDHPINCVNWSQATAYCKWADKRLPTEEEWEFVAGGVERRYYPWGKELKGDELCWNGSSTRKSRGWEWTCPVGSYPAGDTPTGLSDMAGGVIEWTQSFDCPYDKQKPCDKRARSVRGGSWNFNGVTGLRSAARGSFTPDVSQYDTGFRCAKDLSAAAPSTPTQ